MNKDCIQKIKIKEYNSYSANEEEFKFKVVIVGDSGVGKTNLIHRFFEDSFKLDSKATVGVEFMSKTFKINDEVFKIEVWDTAGQERYKSITSAYYKGANGALIVYDITRESSFINIDKWIQEIKERGNPNICLMLIGNKEDLIEERKVNSEMALDKAKMLEIPIIETSALNSNNVVEAFHCILKEMYKNFIIERKGNSYPDNKNENIDNIESNIFLNTNQKKIKCC